jgi:O-antigen ligase
MKVAGLLLFLSWFAASTTRRHRYNRSLLAHHTLFAVALIAWVTWSALSVSWAQSSGTAFSSTYRLALDALLMPIVFAAIRKRSHFVWIVGAFIFGSALSALLGLAQSSTGARLAGGIGDPNDEAAVLVAALALAAGVAGIWARGSTKRFCALAAAAICLAGTLATGSRGGLIALGVMLLAGIFVGGRWRLRAIVLLAASALALVLYINVLASPAAVEHLSSSNSSGRTDLWTVGVRMWEANPVLGVGSGNYINAAIHYVEEPGALTRADLIVDVPHVAHNTYLQVLDDMGVPGLLLFLTLIGASLRAAFSAARRFESSGDSAFGLLARSLGLAIIGTLTAAFFITDNYERLFWLLLALPFPLLQLARSPVEQR